MLNKKDGAAVDFDAPPAKKRKLSCNKAKIFKNASFIVDTDLESSSLSTKKNIIPTENNVNRIDEELPSSTPTLTSIRVEWLYSQNPQPPSHPATFRRSME